MNDNLDSQLLQAASKNDLSSVQLLLAKGAAVGYTDEGSSTAFHEAAYRGHQAILRIFLENGVPVDYKDENGMTGLYAAAAGGHEAIVRIFLENEIPINYEDESGNTALHAAADGGHEAIVRILLKNGAAIDHQDEESRTPLHAAATGGHAAIVKLLLENGVAINLQDEEGRSALHVAASYGHEATVRMLLENGAAIDRQNVHGSTAFYTAAESGHEVIVRMLLENGAAIDHQNVHGETALHAAAESGHEAIVRLLVENGVTVNLKDNYGHTALHEAARLGKGIMVTLLLEKGASILPNRDGQTPLHTAITYGHTDIVNLLLQHGAYAYHQDDDSSFGKYWENLQDADESQLPLYTHLLLGGVSVPEEVDLPEWLAKRKELVDTTISNWLTPLKVSSAVSLIDARKLAKAEYGPAIPSILRALPRLLKWMEAVHNTIKANQEAVDADPENPAEQPLIDRLLITTGGDEALPEEERQRKITLINRLKEKVLPEELLLSIREMIIQQAIVTELRTCYQKIPPRVANYLVAEVMADSEKRYPAFHKALFDHTWKTSLEPPTTSSRQRHTNGVKT